MTLWLMSPEALRVVPDQCDRVACGSHLKTQEGKHPIGMWIQVMGEHSGPLPCKLETSSETRCYRKTLVTVSKSSKQQFYY